MRSQHRDEHLERRVARAGAEARGRAVDAARAGLDRGERVGDAHAEVVVTVEADLGLGPQPGADERRCARVTSSGSM